MTLLGRFPSILMLVGAGCSSPTLPAPPPPPPPPYRRRLCWSSLPRATFGSVLTGRSMEARAADFDGDGDLDLIVAREHAPNILLLNDGTGRFLDVSNRIPQKVRDSEDIVVADFDGDGDLDIVIVSEDETQGTQNEPKHEYYINDGAASFTDASGLIPAKVLLHSGTNGDNESFAVVAPRRNAAFLVTTNGYDPGGRSQQAIVGLSNRLITYYDTGR